MPYERALRLFDTLITPVALYACEFWFPFSISRPSYSNELMFFKFWDKFCAEMLNQKVCRSILSVNKKSSRLAVIGEMGRYPLFCKAISLALKYEWNLNNQSNHDTIINLALSEMKLMSLKGLYCWFTRISNMKSLLNIRRYSGLCKV